MFARFKTSIGLLLWLCIPLFFLFWYQTYLHDPFEMFRSSDGSIQRLEIPVMVLITGLFLIPSFFFGGILVWRVQTYGPGALHDIIGDDEEDLRWALRESTYPVHAREELADLLSCSRDVGPLVAAWSFERENEERATFIAVQLLEDLSVEQTRRVLERALGRIPESALEILMKHWSESDRIASLLPTLAGHHAIHDHPSSAIILLQAAGDRPGMELAAVTAMETSERALATQYLSRWGTLEVLPRLHALREASLLTGDLDALIDTIRQAHGAERGALSLSEDDGLRGGLSQAQTQRGQLSVSED